VALAKALQSKAMKKMNLRCNKVTMKGSVQLFLSLENSEHLNHFEFGENEVGILHKQTGYSAMPVSFDQPEDVSQAFAEMLLSCRESMEHLGLWKCGIGNTSILDDPKVFSNLSELTEVTLQENELEDNHAATLGECLPSLKNLQSLMLRSNNIGPTGARKLTNGIGRCPSLRSIFLDRNKISDFEVLTEIVEVATKSLEKLQDLDISYNFDMLEVARDNKKYRRLLESAVNSFPDSLVKEGDMQTRIESTSVTIVI
jgi:Leucine-rich repeat (LRR) protein